MYKPKVFITLSSSLIFITLVILLIKLDLTNAESFYQKKTKSFQQGLTQLSPPLITQIMGEHSLGCSCPNCLSFGVQK